ncbi:MAG: response regulator [Planctomycetes bacterium]|nr:response regulator [Planctomycetota bacterium]
MRLETVLVVEDSEDLNRSLALRLAKAGFNVVTALDGKCGIEKVRAFDPDLILLDLALPRLSGTKFLEQLRDDPRLGAVAIVVLTGSQDPELEDKLARFGVQRIFRKPTRQKYVVDAVQEILRG